LNYKTDVLDPGFVKQDEKGTGIQSPNMNMVSFGVAADPSGRIWVNTFLRQMTREEEGARVSVGGATRVVRESKIEKMDIHTLEIFSPDGILLGSIPLNHLAHGVRIFGDSLFIWERNNAIIYQYRIVTQP